MFKTSSFLFFVFAGTLGVFFSFFNFKQIFDMHNSLLLLVSLEFQVEWNVRKFYIYIKLCFFFSKQLMFFIIIPLYLFIYEYIHTYIQSYMCTPFKCFKDLINLSSTLWDTSIFNMNMNMTMLMLLVMMMMLFACQKQLPTIIKIRIIKKKK